MTRKRIAVIAVRSMRGEVGGAERVYEGLVAALNGHAVKSELVEVVSDESSFEAIEETYLRLYDLDLAQYYGVVSTKAPSYLVRHPNHVCYLLHTMRVFYDMFEASFPRPSTKLKEQRRLILALDTAALKCPRTKEIFVIGEEVRRRLLEYNQLPAKVLPPATTLDGFHCTGFDYVFLPGRLHRWKRVDLVIKAMKYVKSRARLVISGVGEDGAYFRKLAAGDERISFVGQVSDHELLNLYANSLVVAFVPIREDLGLVTLEAFLSRKPVITCEDSGEPARIVRHEETGFVCAPSPAEIARCIDRLYQNSALARRMGELGHEAVAHITWEKVAQTLYHALKV
jgi:glycosyltransferase involved in cell wall biosynthesis